LACYPLGFINAFEEEIKEHLNIPDEKQIVLGVALGYPDLSAPINRFKSNRDDIRSMIRWII